MTARPDYRAHHAVAARTLARWERIGLGVRLAYNPGCTGLVNCYVGVGWQIVQRGFAAEADVHERMFRLLLQTAADVALPIPWRRHCARQALHPLTRLGELLAHDPPAAAALQARWTLACSALGATRRRVAKDEDC